MRFLASSAPSGVVESRSVAPTVLGRRWCFRKACLVYLTVVFLFCVYFVRHAQGSCINKIRQRLRRSVPRNSLMLNTLDYIHIPGSALTDKMFSTQNDTPPPLQAAGNTKEPLSFSMYRRLILSSGGEETVKSCEPTNIAGLHAITFFYGKIESDEEPQHLLQGVFPSDKPVTLKSARSSTLTEWRIKPSTNYSEVLDESGKSFTIIPGSCPSTSAHLPEEEELFFRALHHEQQLPTLFNVDTLDTVECRFRVKTTQDVLFHPGEEACLPHEDGLLPTRFLLYRTSAFTLMFLAHIIDKHANDSPAAMRMAQIARLNLSLQLVDAVGLIRLKRMLLPSFSLDQIHLDATGTLYILPLAPLRQEVAISYNWTCRSADSARNEWDTAKSLLHIWCPVLTEGLRESDSNPEVAPEEPSLAECSSMPEAVQAMITEILSGKKGVDEVRYVSEPYKVVEFLLQEELRKQSEWTE